MSELDDLSVFDTATSVLPSGQPRCQRTYYATDAWGDSERARCTGPGRK